MIVVGSGRMGTTEVDGGDGELKRAPVVQINRSGDESDTSAMQCESHFVALGGPF